MTTTIMRPHAAASLIWLERMGVAVVVMLHSGCMRFRPLSNGVKSGLLRGGEREVTNRRTGFIPKPPSS